MLNSCLIKVHSKDLKIKKEGRIIFNIFNDDSKIQDGVRVRVRLGLFLVCLSEKIFINPISLYLQCPENAVVSRI